MLYLTQRKNFEVIRNSPVILDFNVKHFKTYAGYATISDLLFRIELFNPVGTDTRDAIDDNDVLLSRDTTTNPTEFSFSVDENEVTFTTVLDVETFRHVDRCWYRLYIEYAPSNYVVATGSITII